MFVIQEEFLSTNHCFSAVVEQVCNVGTNEEYILISQSYYGGDIGHVARVDKSSMYGGRPYSFAWGYTLEGFCISPVCQLCNVGEMLIDIEILIVEVELIGGARGCGQTGFALRFLCIFLSGICAVFSAKRI